MSEKEVDERVGNNLLFLYLVGETSKAGEVEDNFKAQKLVFLSEKQLIQRKLKAFNYTFLRWHRGPYCKDLANDIKRLQKAGLLRKDGERIVLTDFGRGVLQHFGDVLARQATFTEPIKKVAQEYGPIAPDDLKERVYDMSIFVPKIRRVMKIRDIEEKSLILFKMSEGKAKKSFTLDESSQATLELVFNKEAQDSLRMAQRDAVEGRVCDFNSL